MDPETAVLLSKGVLVITGQVTVGPTTDTEPDAALADEQAAVAVTVAVYTSPAARVRPLNVQAPVLLAVVVQLAAVGLVLFTVILALAGAVP